MAIHFRRPGRTFACALALGTLVAAAAASSVSARQITQSAATRGAADLPQLHISIGSETSRYADLFVARYEGFFRKAGVDAVIENNGSTSSTVVVAGRADIGLTGASGTFSFDAQGKPLKLIYATSYGNSAGFVVRTSSPYHTAADLGHGGVTIGIQQTGLLRGQANSLNNWLQSKGLQPANVANVSTPTGDFASIVAGGTVDTSAVDYNTAAPYLAANQLRFISDLTPNSPLMQQLLPPGTLNIAFWASPDTLQSKKNEIVRFIAGLRMADRWLAKSNDKTVAVVLHNTVPSFQALSVDTLTKGVASDRHIWATKQEGYISGKAWTESLATYGNWNLPYDLSNSMFSYANDVDMSDWNAATPIVNKLYPKAIAAKKKK